MSLDESLEDFKFIDALPGKKLLIKGNHDYWWDTVSKIKNFFAKNDINSIDILHNNAFFHDEVAICGTRGWLLEDKENLEHSVKITSREKQRLRTSLKAAGDAEQKLCFLHYPPRYKDLICQEIVDVMHEFDVKHCWYGHVHGIGHRHAVTGNVDGITYKIVSADYIDFRPLKVK
jgi:predicted phosphohydrolase